MVFEADAAQRLSVTPAVEEGGDEVDHRPAQPGEQAQRAGEVGEQQVHALPPGQNEFHGELRHGLEPGQDSQREGLGDKELSRFSRPGDEHGGQQDGWRRPQRGARSRPLERRKGQQGQSASQGLAPGSVRRGRDRPRELPRPTRR